MEELNLKTGALILDLDAKYIRAEPNAKCRRGNARMPGYVGESLLDDAVGSGFDLLAKTLFQAAVFELDADACLRSVAIDQPQERRQQPQVVQHGRAPAQGQIACLGHEFLDQSLSFTQTRAQVLTVGQSACLQDEAQAGQRLANLIVQLPSEGAPLRFLHFQQAPRQRSASLRSVMSTATPPRKRRPTAS